jgi:hypothetical protein
MIVRIYRLRWSIVRENSHVAKLILIIGVLFMERRAASFIHRGISFHWVSCALFLSEGAIVPPLGFVASGDPGITPMYGPRPGSRQ